MTRIKRNWLARSERATWSRCFESLEERRMLTSVPALVKDINATTADSDPANFVAFQGAVYFTTKDSELCKTDGTEAGTELVKSLGGVRGIGQKLVVFGDHLWVFWYYEDSFRIWKSDGTSAGTVVAVDMPADHADFPYGLAVVGDAVYFSAGSGDAGRELWKSDGTASGTMMVKDIAAGNASSSPGYLTELNGKLVFTADDGVHGEELWTSDGTAAGTVMVKDINPGTSSDGIRLVTKVSGTLFFEADYPAHHSLWKSDGTAAGTAMIDGVRLPGYFVGMANLNGELLFAGMDSAGDVELWKSDGTSEGTTRVQDIHAYSSSEPRWLINLGGTLYFQAWGTDYQVGIWKSDGTEAGTRLVQEISSSYQISVRPLAIVNGKALFEVLRDNTVIQLWGADDLGVSVLLEDWSSGFRASGGVVLGNSLIFSSDAGSYGDELWTTDGTPTGTMLIKDINTTVTDGSSWPMAFVGINGTTLFLANDGNHGEELWRTDGTTDGTALVKDITPGLRGTSVNSMYNVNGVALILVTYVTNWSDDKYGSALWRSDGTSAGTVLVHDFGIASNSFGYWDADVVDGMLFFRYGKELWESDGTTEGTSLIKGFNSGLSDLGHVGGDLFFAADDGSGVDLWKSNGTHDGTTRVKDFDPETSRTDVTYLTNANGRLFFLRDVGSVRTLWTSDGTTEGTVALRQLTSTRYLESLGGLLLFDGIDDSGHGALFESDGTVAGTQVIAEGWSSELTEVDGTCYFVKSDDATGSELWKTDGTTVGTQLVKDIAPGPAGSYPRQLINVGGALYFLANDETLWTSDGTSSGTVKVSDRIDAEYLETASGKLFFANRDSSVGAELWTLHEASVVVGRHVFYNESTFDQMTAEASTPDDEAIATDKVAYRPSAGGASANSVTSYDKGINGLMIDLVGIHGALTAADFDFRIGTNNAPELWTAAPDPAEITVRAGAGANGSDRVEIIWPDGAIKNTWLQVIVKGNDAQGGFNTNTGLAESDVFYFGNRVGDTFAFSPDRLLVTNAADAIAVRLHASAAEFVTSIYDFNRDGQVDAADEGIAHTSVGFLPLLALGGTIATPTTVEVPPQGALWTPDVPAIDEDQDVVAFALAATDDARVESLVDNWWFGLGHSHGR